MAEGMLYPGERRPSRLSVLERRYSHLSSDTTSVTIDESMTEEEVLETLQAHKQIISTIKTQTWPMYRKLKVLRKAKMYIKRHEGELKQSKQAKDIMAKYKTYMEKTIKKTKREIANLIVQMTPWEMRIKKIESQFGSVVASYFTFLRWVFWINTFISVFICIFLMVPEVLRGHDDPTGMRKEVKNQESALTLQSIWDFEGYLKFSPIFYGYYSSDETTDMGYRLPLAYFLTSMILYLFSFFCILRKMTQTAKMSRAGSQEDEYVFSWKVFTGWDYLIGNSETAYNKVASIVMGLKEVILEEKERKKEEKQDWKMIVLRILANIFVLFLLGTSAYAVVLVVERSQDMPEKPGWLRENEVTLVVAGIGIVYPNIFNMIGMVEAYHPGVQLKWQLARILVLNLLNLYTLMFSLFGKVDIMTASLQTMKYNITHDKRIRMTWETEVMVTVMTEAALERLERSLDRKVTDEPQADDEIDLEEMEGRYWWRGADGRMTGTGRRTQAPKVSENSTSFFDVNGSTTTVAPSTTSRPTHRPVIIKDEWISATIDPNSDIIEGRKALPAAPRTTTTTTTTTTTAAPSTQRATTKVKEKTTSPPKSTSRASTVTTRPTTTSQATTPPSIATVTGTMTDENTIQTEIITSAYIDLDVDSETGSGTGVFEGDIDEMSTLSPTVTTLERQFCSSSTEAPTLRITDDDLLLLSEEEKETLRTLCWETMFGQELTKLTVMDLVLTAVSTVIGDFLRAVIVRYCNGKACFFWDLEKGFPGYSDFPIAENILHLVNNQGMVWLGMFFSPGLPAINTIKLCMMMYLRSWAVLTCNIPHETVFKASGNNFYYALLLLMLFICCLPVAYTCVWLEPSWHCGPFSEYERVYHILTKYIESKLPATINKVVDYLTSPGSIIPLLLLLTLIIYYLLSRVAQLNEANADLKGQLRKEKDLNPEMMKNAETPANGLNALAEKKHVRIQEELTLAKPELQLPDDGSTTDNS